MAKQDPTASIFSQKLDRIVFTAYFLGAVVPLLALAFVVNEYVLPTATDRLAWLGLVALVISVASLTLGSFGMLRRTTHRTIARMDRNNRRLASLLEAAGSFANALHESEAAATAVRCARELTEADAVLLYTGGNADKPPALLQSLGPDADALLVSSPTAVEDLLDLVLAEKKPVLRGADARGPWGRKVAAAVPLAGEADALGALIAVRTGTGDPFDSGEVDALATLGALASVSIRNSDLRDAQRNFFAHVTELLVTALDAHLEIQSGHGPRVAQYANRVGREMQLDDRQLQRLHFAALLHDIGMLRIDRSRMGNSRACEAHPRIGARMLERIRLWQDLAPIVLHHHERFDGGGYPEGLAGESIPLEARIIAVCEAFDVMVSESSYKTAVEASSALRELSECSGAQFDPRVVDVFTGLADRGVIEPL
jgi:putative nucleotidyltransferase with HDIG domain